MYVYVIVNSETLKIYIGQHKGTNLRKYLQTKFSDAQHQLRLRSRLYRSMRKYPKQVWSIHPLISDLQTREECDYWERLLIKTLNTQHPDVGYNICRGGEGFTGLHTEEQKRNLSEKSKAWHAGLTEEKRQEQNRKISLATMGVPRPHSIEAEAKRQAAFQLAVAQGKTKSYGMQGKKHSEETLTKMRIAATDRVITPEAKKNMSASHTGKPWSAKRRAAYNKTISSISV